jgi:chemotaxis protein methyltransferase CheR
MFEFLFGASEEEKAPERPRYRPVEDLSPVFRWLRETLGIADLEKRPILADRLRFLAEKGGYATGEAMVAAMGRDTRLRDAVIDAATINETYFFREYDTLFLAAERAAGLSSPRILSLPSSDGSELYSLAILLHRLDPRVLERATLVGVDVSARAIAKAREGLYGEHALHRLEPSVVATYFDRTDEGWRIKAFLRRQARFEVANLFEATPERLGRFDLLLSRNLLIYFDEQARIRAAERLASLVAPGGWLVTGVSDPFPALEGFRRVRHAIYERVVA